MKVMLTGAFGNVGTSTIEALIEQGHQIRCFDVNTKQNRKVAKRFKDQIEVVWGDIRRHEDVAKAMKGCETVIHLCFIIPSTTSWTGKSSEVHPEWAREINMGGTQNVISAAKALPNPPKIVFGSSTHVFGRTQHLPPPRTVSDPVFITDHYTEHKLACEELIKASGLEWVILRFCAVMPIRMIMDAEGTGLFKIPLDTRIEFVHTKDVGLALASTTTCDEAAGKTLLIGGGRRCQMYYRELMGRILEAFGLGRLPDKAYATEPDFPQDWIDTTESQELLKYQQRIYDDYIDDMRAVVGFRRYLATMFRPIARWYMLRQSPYYRQAKG
jgi:nucleoside-diphosphate-sugar epimerase